MQNTSTQKSGNDTNSDSERNPSADRIALLPSQHVIDFIRQYARTCTSIAIRPASLSTLNIN